MTLKITSDNIASTTLSTLGGAKITSLTYPSSATAANPAGSETITVTGSGFSAGATVYVDTTSCSTTYVSATSLTFTSPVKTAGEYHLYVYNTDGTFAMKPGGYISSSVPVWVTSSGALSTATTNQSYSTTVSATGDGTITYSVTTGSLPTGLSLNSSTGAITGTPTVEATNNFTITATDSENQIVPRSFSIDVLSAVSAEYLVVAGGGGSGSAYGAGGGAGGLLTNSSILSFGSTYTITVGSGGSSGAVGSNSSISGTGFSTVTSIGGGNGGMYQTPFDGQNGGSGGGGASGSSLGIGGKGVYPGSSYLNQARQGYDGGAAAQSGGYSSAGGGGAGAAGSDVVGAGNSGKGGNGGTGVASSITGTSVYYAGGGGGWGYDAGGGGGTGGAGGGGNGAGYTSVPSTGGTINTGGGGGGSYGGGTAGGSGVVILRFLSTVTVSATTGSPTITTDGSYKVYKFTASGSITF